MQAVSQQTPSAQKVDEHCPGIAQLEPLGCGVGVVLGVRLGVPVPVTVGVTVSVSVGVIVTVAVGLGGRESVHVPSQNPGPTAVW